MSVFDAALATSRTLDRAGIDHMLVGALVSSYFGITRSTVDADFVIHLAEQRIAAVARALEPGFVLDPQPRFELFTGKTYYAITMERAVYTVDLFQLSLDPFDQESFSRRRKLSMHGQEICVQTAEDLIVQKLRWQRFKDLSDVQDVLGTQQVALDFVYIERWCDAHGTRELLDRLRSEIPPI